MTENKKIHIIIIKIIINHETIVFRRCCTFVRAGEPEAAVAGSKVSRRGLGCARGTGDGCYDELVISWIQEENKSQYTVSTALQ